MKTYLLDAIEKNNVIPLSALKQYLWKDEMNDLFILTKHMELHLYSGYETDTIKNAVLGCYCWSKKYTSLLQKKRLIFDLWSSDDGLYTFKTKIENLPFILILGAFGKRPHIKGNWIRDKERRLGHRIFLYETEKVRDYPGMPEGLKNYHEEQHRIAMCG